MHVSRDGGLDEHSAAFFYTLAEMIPQMVWTKNADGVNDYCNRRFREYMNLTIDEFANNSWIVCHPEDAARGQAVWGEARRNGSAYEVELRLRPKDKAEYRWFLVRAVPYRDDSGRVVKWFGSTTDIDVQKRYMEEQERIVRVLVDLLSPDDLPVLEHVRRDAAYVPAENVAAVGGDFYTALILPDGRLLFAIGDVAGHGISAAVMMERVRSAIVTASVGHENPADVLAQVNRVLALRHGLPFVTALLGFLDPESGRFTYSCAGHPGPVLVNARGEARLLDHGGLPLGVSDEPGFPTFDGSLRSGEALVLYTDGITEFRRDIDAGQELLLSAAARCCIAAEKFPAQSIRRDVLGEKEPRDDIALLTITSTR